MNFNKNINFIIFLLISFILITLPYSIGSYFKYSTISITHLKNKSLRNFKHAHKVTNLKNLKYNNCLANTIYYEARGEPIKGQLAVANVVMNRVKNKHYPNTICKVVHQRVKKYGRFICQFSWYCNKNKLSKHKKSWKLAIKISKIAEFKLKLDPTKGATHYFAYKLVKPKWSYAKKNIISKIIGNHMFLKYERL